ncbi:PTS system, beta-glucoside-specific IIA component [Enterococcus sp. AZ194]|uniref:beta-glucoside-specific PTS transporter subunit IIABC n=1 Tax=Enterococcus sp. AZ194 TaxID=2774629 RepID=UPI003F224357
MNYRELAATIIEDIGGEKNIRQLTHCATRLRFNLKDESIVAEEKLRNTTGVMGAVSKGGQYQVIIGSDVGNVYKEVMDQTSIETKEDFGPSRKKGVAAVIDTITGIFTPILPAITASGMLKAVLSLLVVFNWLSVESQTYQILNFMGDAAFYFLPILLAASSAQKFKTNMYLAMMLGGILLHPSFVAMVTQAKEAGTAISLIGLPVSAVSYSSSVIPIILSVWFMSYVEPIADKVSPKAIKFFSKPLLTIFVVGTVSLVAIGPLGYIISDAISNGITTLESLSPWLVPVLLGTFTPLFVATGTHYGLVPIGINNRMTMGYDSVIYPGMLASNVSQGAASLAVGVKSKNKELKQLAFSAGLTGIFGITEPALYGVNLKYKTPLYGAMIGGGLGGLFMGIMKVKNFTGGSPGLLTLPSYIGDNTLSFFYSACIGAGISVIASFIATFILYKDKLEEPTTIEDAPTLKRTIEKETLVFAPLTGEVHSLKEVNDGVFSEGILGEGIAIIPTENKVYSPVNGVITATFDSGHAVGITSDEGIEILVHVGIDTVQMNGEGFNYLVEKGQNVEVGDALLTFDMGLIKEHGYNVITPVVITNSALIGDILNTETGAIQVGDNLFKIYG